MAEVPEIASRTASSDLGLSDGEELGREQREVGCAGRGDA